jgi:hypothetical protein
VGGENCLAGSFITEKQKQTRNWKQPLTATGYILSALLGNFLLSEQVTFERWRGVLLIFLGTVVVGATSRNAVASAVPMDRYQNAKRGDNR